MRYSQPRRIPKEFDQEIIQISQREQMPYSAAMRQWVKGIRKVKKEWQDRF